MLRTQTMDVGRIVPCVLHLKRGHVGVHLLLAEQHPLLWDDILASLARGGCGERQEERGAPGGGGGMENGESEAADQSWTWWDD